MGPSRIDAGYPVKYFSGSQGVAVYQGILQGILRFWGSETRFGKQETAALQPLLEQFPTQIIRDNILRIREFLNGIRELQ
jgi:hypothetical protein